MGAGVDARAATSNNLWSVSGGLYSDWHFYRGVLERRGSLVPSGQTWYSDCVSVRDRHVACLHRPSSRRHQANGMAFLCDVVRLARAKLDAVLVNIVTSIPVHPATSSAASANLRPGHSLGGVAVI